MEFRLLAAIGWNDFATIIPFVVAILIWVITHFAGKVQPKAPPQRRPVQPPADGPAQAAKDPLQAEIDEFLRQAQTMRGNRPADQKKRETASPQTPATPPQRPRPLRRTASNPPKRGAKREETKTFNRPILSPVVEVVEAPPQRQSLADRGEQLDSGKFAQRAAQMSKMQEESDTEFQKHMQRVFSRDLSTLKTASLGVFEAAGASAKAATATADAAATKLAAGAESATAPNVARKQASDIALFLAGRKNIRDAVILSEILNRPEGRW